MKTKKQCENIERQKRSFYYGRVWNSSKDKILYYQARLMKLQTQKIATLKYRLEEADAGLVRFRKKLKRMDRADPRKIAQKEAFYSDWRITVLVRDNFTCQDCKDADISLASLEVHHILPWKDNVNSRYDPENGVTLCKSCHRMRHKEMRTGIQTQRLNR